MPQSGATRRRSAGHVAEGGADPPLDRLDVLDRAAVGEVDHSDDEALARHRFEDREVDSLLGGFDRDLVDGSVRKLGQEGIAVGSGMDDVGVSEAGVQGGLPVTPPTARLIAAIAKRLAFSARAWR